MTFEVVCAFTIASIIWNIQNFIMICLLDKKIHYQKGQIEALIRRETVRCEDCKHYRYYGLSQDTVSECELDICPNPARDWFCAEGERQ